MTCKIQAVQNLLCCGRACLLVIALIEMKPSDVVPSLLEHGLPALLLGTLQMSSEQQAAETDLISSWDASPGAEPEQPEFPSRAAIEAILNVLEVTCDLTT